MLDKLDPYDLIGIIVPGVLLAYWLPVCFPAAVGIAAAADFPEAIDVIGFVAFAVFLGHLIQALASVIQPFLYRTWGGTPSDRALSHGLGQGFISANAGMRIRGVLLPLASPDAEDHDLFRIALIRANASPTGRAHQFNLLYAYHRALLIVLSTAILLTIASRFWGEAMTWPLSRFGAVLITLLGMLVIMWHRAKQRAFYFVTEVLHVAEHTITARSSSGDSTHKE